MSYDCSVALTADNRRFAETLSRGPEPGGEQIDCFALDSSWVRLPLWKSSGNKQVICDDEHKVFYYISPEKTEIEILTTTGNRAARIALMRVVREFAMAHSYRTGGLFIHGAAFSVAGRCVVVAGPKGAGKTTLLMHVLHQQRARFVTNDRLLVFFNDQGAVGHGMPTIVSIREESLAMLPGLYCRLVNCSYHPASSLIEEAGGRPIHLGRGGRCSLSPAQFCHFLQVHPTPQDQLGALVFPHVTATQGTIELQRLTPQGAANRLAGTLFRAHSCQKTASLFTLSRDSQGDNPQTVENLCLKLASQVPCFDGFLGLEAYEGTASASLLIGLVS
ncbi:MAG: GTP-binding protein [Candidatus Binatia bacterium]